MSPDLMRVLNLTEVGRKLAEKGMDGAATIVAQLVVRLYDTLEPDEQDAAISFMENKQRELREIIERETKNMKEIIELEKMMEGKPDA